MFKIIGIIFGIIFTFGIIAAGAMYVYFGPDPILLKPSSILEDVQVQPGEALELTNPHLKEHGTYQWGEDGDLQLYIVRQKDWYYISQTDYPAKTLRYYMQPAVKVHVQTGEIEFSKR